MELEVRHAQILRALIYPIQFDSEPASASSIERVLKFSVFADHLKFTVADVIAAIDAGLASDDKLADLLPQNHPEAMIRNFLAAVRTRLEAEPPGSKA
jgi:predicted RNase H-like nuclease